MMAIVLFIWPWKTTLQKVSELDTENKSGKNHIQHQTISKCITFEKGLLDWFLEYLSW